MSIARIESAYAYFLGKEMSGPQMSVLQALAYCANQKENERCFPSDAFLSKLTHLGDKTVERARKALRDKHGAIIWEKGGRKGGSNVSNRYRFLFPLVTMKSAYESYETVTATPPAVTLTPPIRQSDPTLPSERRSNTEATLKTTLKSKPETSPTPSFDFKFAGCSGTGTRTFDPFDHDHSSPLQAAMALCGVKDADNNKTFGKYMGCLGVPKSWDIVDTFRSEINQGEHDNARNLAAILTKRLKEWAVARGVCVA